MGADTFFLQLDAPRARVQRSRQLLLERFPAGVEERELGAGVQFIVYFPDPAALAAAKKSLAGTLGLRAVHTRSNWQQAWTQHLTPQLLSSKLLVVPVDKAPPPSRTTSKQIYLLRRAAFGFGEHVTTRLVARALERELAEKSEQMVLDVGTGTGGLCIAAARLGAAGCLGIDIDQPSVRVAKANAALNRLAARCKFSCQPLHRVKRRFDLVLANLDRVTLLALAPELARVLNAEGKLLVSGILDETRPELDAAFKSHALKRVERASEDGWTLLGYQRR
ncbi:MAG TPA: 50S ribosomal protein L11 methyltransferase [Polyangiaceae bacterium]|nr:50S ribosomal protein L11 methyltransferase [Polyangiaceae bacterium]